MNIAKIRNNIIIVNILIITTALSLSTLMFLNHLQSEALRQARATQETAIKTFWELLRAKGSDFRIVDNTLLAGTYVINGNFELPDKIRAIFGGTATIFMGDTRVTTNVPKEDGSRAIGTKLTGPAYDAIFNKRTNYRGEAPILGTPYFTAYDPIYDKNGTIIGVLYVGIKKSDFLAVYDQVKNNFIIGSIAVELLLIALAWGILRERVRAEKSLRASEAEYRAVFDTTGTATFLVEDDTTIMLVNNEFTRLFGYERDEVEGKLSWTVLAHPSDRERMLEYHRARRDAPGVAPARYEFTSVTKDGTIRQILAHVNLIPGTRRSVASYQDITELKELQDAIRNQLGFLQTLVDAIPNPVFYKDKTGRYLGCNRAFAAALGKSKDALVGKTVYDISDREIADKYLETDEELFANPGTQEYEYKLVFADGTPHDVIFNKATFTDKTGEIAGIVGVISDISERKRAEEKFRSLVEQSLIGIYIIQESKFVYVNPKMSEIFGYTKEELTSGLSHLDLTVEEDREKAAEFVRRRIAGEIKSIHYEFRGLCKDGAIRDIEVFGTATVFNGKPAVIGTLLDISGRKRAEKALKESEERFSKLFSENDDAIILFKLDDFVIFDANPATTELTGFSRDELLQLTPASIIDPDDFRRLIDVIPIDDQSKAFQITRAVTRRKDGSSLCVAIRAKILRMQEEYIVHCSIRDMSETYRLEDEVKNTQAKLIQTNKMTSIGMLASSVAHEINNPNNCISVNADMLTDVWRDAEPLLERLQSEQGDFMLRGIPFTQMQNVAPRLLNGITESSRRITAIVNNMREFVREDKSGLQGAIDVNHLVRNAASILWHHIHIYTDNFRVNLQEPLPPAKGNGQQIEQVIINLLMNALQALPDKTSGVQVETVDTSDQGIVTVIIRDEGSGMDHSVMSRLKEPFFSTKLGRGGTGLGLYISDAIIKEHEGELEFSSIPGKGTEATVRLKIWD